MNVCWSGARQKRQWCSRPRIEFFASVGWLPREFSLFMCLYKCTMARYDCLSVPGENLNFKAQLMGRQRSGRLRLQSIESSSACCVNGNNDLIPNDRLRFWCRIPGDGGRKAVRDV